MMRSVLLMVVLHARNAAMVIVFPVPGGPSISDKGYSSVRWMASCCHLSRLFHERNVLRSRTFLPSRGVPSWNFPRSAFYPDRKSRLAEMAGINVAGCKIEKRADNSRGSSVLKLLLSLLCASLASSWVWS